MIEVGDALPNFGFTVKDLTTGALKAPASFTVTLTAPDGTTPTVTVVNGSTGVYTVAYVATMGGRYTATGTAVGNNTDAVTTLVWDVDDTTPIVSLDDVRAHLGVNRTDSDERLRTFALLGTELVERHTGRLWRRQSVTEVHDGGQERIRLLKTPVVSVTSIVEFYSPVTLFVFDPIACTISRGTPYGGYRWLPGVQNITVTYVAGATKVPTAIRMGALEIIRHLWDTMRGGYSIPKQQGAGDDWDPRQGFVMPRRVAEMLDTYKAPGF